MKHEEWCGIVEAAETYEELNDPRLEEHVLKRVNEVKRNFWIGNAVWVVLMVACYFGFIETEISAMLMGVPLLIIATSALEHSECANDIRFLEVKRIHMILDELLEEPHAAIEDGPGPEI